MFSPTFFPSLVGGGAIVRTFWFAIPEWLSFHYYRLIYYDDPTKILL